MKQLFTLRKIHNRLMNVGLVALLVLGACNGDLDDGSSPKSENSSPGSQSLSQNRNIPTNLPEVTIEPTVELDLHRNCFTAFFTYINKGQQAFEVDRVNYCLTVERTGNNTLKKNVTVEKKFTFYHSLSAKPQLLWIQYPDNMNKNQFSEAVEQEKVTLKMDFFAKGNLLAKAKSVTLQKKETSVEPEREVSDYAASSDGDLDANTLMRNLFLKGAELAEESESEFYKSNQPSLAKLEDVVHFLIEYKGTLGFFGESAYFFLFERNDFQDMGLKNENTAVSDLLNARYNITKNILEELSEIKKVSQKFLKSNTEAFNYKYRVFELKQKAYDRALTNSQIAPKGWTKGWQKRKKESRLTAAKEALDKAKKEFDAKIEPAKIDLKNLAEAFRAAAKKLE